MSPILTHLKHTQQRLLRLDRHAYAAADQQVLHELLLTTILDVQALYFDTVASAQRIRLLHCLSVLELEFPAYSSPIETSLSAWQQLHESLLTCLAISLAPLVGPLPGSGPCSR